MKYKKMQCNFRRIIFVDSFRKMNGGIINSMVYCNFWIQLPYLKTQCRYSGGTYDAKEKYSV